VSQAYASVLIPTRDPGPSISNVLAAVFAQETSFAYDVHIVDSGSGADDLARMQRFPVDLRQIPSTAFGHGRTRNLLAEGAQGEVLLFLSQDAEPASNAWMRRLVAPLADPRVAGAYARQIARPGADPFIQFFLRDTYGPRPSRRSVQHSHRLTIDDMFFSNVSSALRADAWREVPFRDDVPMSEDQYWAFDALRAGYELAYEPEAQVYHSHNYSLTALFRRNRLSGRSLRGLIADSPAAVVRRGARYVVAEGNFLVRRGQMHLLPYMLVYEFVKSVGFALGSLEGGNHQGTKDSLLAAVQRS
jgi:rhamnosyltransferase